MSARLVIPVIALMACTLFQPASTEARRTTRNSFEWMRPIVGDVRTGQVFRVAVPPDVYAQCDNFPHDIRIFDGRDTHWPFFLQARPPQLAHNTLTTDTINESWIEGDEPHLRIDLAVEQESDTPRVRHGRVSIHTAGQDFVRRVEIYGSEDQIQWGLLGKGYLVNVRTPRRIEENAIDYPVSDFPHLQIRIFPNTRDAQETLEIIRVLLQVERIADVPTYPVDAQTIPTPPAERLDDAQVIVLDLGYAKHPIEAVRLRATGGDYIRHVVVHTRDDSESAWRLGGAGDIHRIGASVKDEVTVRREGRFIKCEIYHYDDAPLDIASIEVRAIRDYLVIEARSATQPVLYYGGPYHLNVPRYDLRARLDPLPAQDWTVLALGEPRRNPDYRATGYGRWGPILAAIAVGLTSIGVIAVIVMMFKHAATLPPEETG